MESYRSGLSIASSLRLLVRELGRGQNMPPSVARSAEYPSGARIYKEQLMSAIPRFPMIPNLTEPDPTPTEVRSPLPAAFGRIEPTAIAFISGLANFNHCLV